MRERTRTIATLIAIALTMATLVSVAVAQDGTTVEIPIVLYNDAEILGDPHRVEISGMGQYTSGDVIEVEPNTTINYRLRRGGVVGPWQQATFPDDITVDGDWTLEFATVSVTLYNDEEGDGIDAEDLLYDPHRVEVSSVGQYVTGDTFHVPPGANISFRLRRGGVVGPWQARQFEAGDQEWELEFATVHIGLCDEIDNPPQVEVSGVGMFDIGDIIHVPPGANISFRLREDGTAGPWMVAQFGAGDTSWDLGGAINWAAECDPFVPVELSHFEISVDDGIVTLTWTTGSETENLGYNIYRGLTKEGEYDKLTVELIEGAGSSRTTQTYQFIDQDVQPGKTYFYKLEQIDFDGTKEVHGPVAVRVEKGTAVQPSTWGLIKSLLR